MHEEGSLVDHEGVKVRIRYKKIEEPKYDCGHAGPIRRVETTGDGCTGCGGAFVRECKLLQTDCVQTKQQWDKVRLIQHGVQNLKVCERCEHYDPVEVGPKKKTEINLTGTIRPVSQRDSPRSRIEEVCTAIVTAFRRPGCVGRLVASIKERYPGLRILVGDSGDMQPHVPDGDATIVPMPPDCGISFTRNRLTQMVDTPYTILLDDDNRFHEETSIEALIRIQEHTGAGAVGMTWISWPEMRRHQWTMNLSERDKVLMGEVARGPIQQTPDGDRFHSADTIHNSALYQTQVLKDLPWNETLKVMEHLEFFVRMKRQRPDIKLVHAVDVSVFHDHSRDRTPEYNKGRNRGHYDALAQKIMKLRERRTPQWNEFFIDHDAEPGFDCSSRPSLMVIGTGACGTTVTVQMLQKLGWTLPADVDEHNESVSLRQLLMNNDANRFVREAVLLPPSTVVKDPRIAEVVKGNEAALSRAGYVLVWVQRDLADVQKSFERREWPYWGEDRWESCREFFRDWPGAKIAVTFDQLQAMAQCWDGSKIHSSNFGQIAEDND